MKINILSVNIIRFNLHTQLVKKQPICFSCFSSEKLKFDQIGIDQYEYIRKLMHFYSYTKILIVQILIHTHRIIGFIIDWSIYLEN